MGRFYTECCYEKQGYATTCNHLMLLLCEDELTQIDKILPAIAQLVEHLTVDAADIRWSLVRFRVAGFGCQVFQLRSGSCCTACAYFWIAFFSSLTEQTAYQGKEGIEPCMPPNLNIDVSSSACLAILVKRNFMSMGTWPQATHQVPSRNST